MLHWFNMSAFGEAPGEGCTIRQFSDEMKYIKREDAQRFTIQEGFVEGMNVRLPPIPTLLCSPACSSSVLCVM